MKNVKKQLACLNDMITKKGYNAVLDKQESRHTYYIQLLEMRVIMLDRVLKLLDQINGGNKVTAVAIEVCQKKSEGCK